MPCVSKHAVVTGASTGIGRATTLRLCRDGFHVFATVRRQADAQSLQQLTEGAVSCLLLDVTAPEQISQAAQAVQAHVGPSGLDALVNNAGVGLAWPVELVPLEKFRWQFSINVEGQIAVTQAFLPLIRAAAGRIVMIGSIGDRITMPFAGPLASAKHAVRSLTDAMRLELAPWNIRVILIEPASIRTDAIGKLERDVDAAEFNFGRHGWALYGQAFSQMTTKALAREVHGSHPDVVAATISCAISHPRPKARYLSGKDARLLAAVATLPPYLLDRLRRRFFNLPQPGSAASARINVDTRPYTADRRRHPDPPAPANAESP